MTVTEPPHRARFRFISELNEFLPPLQRGQWLTYRFNDFPGIKDPIETLGIPHTQVELITVNRDSVDFSYQLRDGDRVVVYPHFTALDTHSIRKLPAPPRCPAFVLDVHLGKLARLLRLAGLDVLYRNDYLDPELVAITETQGRVLLTRDRRLLFHRRVQFGHFVRSIVPLEQAREVICRFELGQRLQPFSRCLNCNGLLAPVAKAEIEHRLQPKTVRYYHHFYRCRDCQHLYWSGSHLDGLQQKIQCMRGEIPLTAVMPGR